MHLIRLDIDRKNSAAQLQVGPLGGGLNAIYAPLAAGATAMSRFVRNVLFRGYVSDSSFDNDDHEAFDGSLHWVDASGHVRLMSYAGGASLFPNRYIHSPLHPSNQPILDEDRNHIRGIGNIFWEGGDTDSRWDELRGDILGMIFCSSLGSVSPEKLWWAASRLGVHAPAKSEPDEGYQRLKAEERELLDRLRNTESVDHDRAWWSLERDRLAAEIQHVRHANHISSSNAPSRSTHLSPLEERLASIKIEIARLRAVQQDHLMHEANTRPEPMRRDDHRFVGGLPSSNGATRSFADRGERVDHTAERQRLQNKIDQLLAEQANVEIQLRSAPPVETASVPSWDDSQLRQQHAYAEEMLRRWDRRTQMHRRLAEVQSHLRTRSPYRRTTEGSLVPLAEQFLRELTSGAVRQLPPWALEASHLHVNHAYGEFQHDAQHTVEYRDEFYDRTLPSSNTRQRRIVDLAIRLAIAQAAVPRIGRIPMLFENSIEGFRGEALEQILFVLGTFARDGRQILLPTGDEFIARRISAHGGTVSRMNEVLRYAKPQYVVDASHELGLHPAFDVSPVLSWNHAESHPMVSQPMEREFGEVNRQLVGLANEQSKAFGYPKPDFVAPTVQRSKYFLTPEHNIADAPATDPELVARLNQCGIHRVGDLLNADLARLSHTLNVELLRLEYIQRVAALMCSTPQLRAFDARVLVGSGIDRSRQLRELPAMQLVAQVESYLASPSGQDVIRSASQFELTRIRQWMDSIRQSHRQPSSRDDARGLRIARSSRSRDRETAREPKVRETRAREPQAVVASKPSVASGTAAPRRFFLDIASPIVDAPSIGPRMAAKLQPLSVNSVGDLIGAQAAELATRLADRAVSPEVVLQWQQQALLVCRIPNLRGHDAQLLVSSGITTAEQVAASSASQLYDIVVRTASSKLGQRILRGSPAPDRTEVEHWINWAQNSRVIRAA